MKYMSLVALCSLLLLIPACKNGNDGCGTACCPPTTQETTEVAAAPAVEVAEEEFVETTKQQPTTVSVGSDKEDLEEAELVAVMNNK